MRQNSDRDPVLRHGLVMALSSNATIAQLRAASGTPNASVRMGSLLALRQLRDPGVADYLNDTHLTIQREAARAIFDGEIDSALATLAACLSQPSTYDEVIAWRALNAARQLGKPEHAQAIAEFARDASRPTRARIEAIDILAEWPSPHGQDRIVGNWRPCEHPEPERAATLAGEILPGLLTGDAKVEAAKLVRQGFLEHPPEALAAILRETIAELPRVGELADSLRELRIPTLVVVGTADRGSLDPCRELAHLLPEATLVEIEGAGHVVNLAAPAAFNEALEAFLARLG